MTYFQDTFDQKKKKWTNLTAKKRKQNRLIYPGTNSQGTRCRPGTLLSFKSFSTTVRATATYGRLIMQWWPYIGTCHPTTANTTGKTRDICQAWMHSVLCGVSDPVQQSNRGTLHGRITSWPSQVMCFRELQSEPYLNLRGLLKQCFTHIQDLQIPIYHIRALLP